MLWAKSPRLCHQKLEECSSHHLGCQRECRRNNHNLGSKHPKYRKFLFFPAHSIRMVQNYWLHSWGSSNQHLWTAANGTKAQLHKTPQLAPQQNSFPKLGNRGGTSISYLPSMRKREVSKGWTEIVLPSKTSPMILNLLTFKPLMVFSLGITEEEGKDKWHVG